MKTWNHSVRILGRLLLAAAALAIVAPATAALAAPFWSGERVEGSGKISRQDRELGHFNAIAFALPGKLELRIGHTEGLSIETDDNLLPLIETVVENGTLHLRPVRGNLDLETRHLKIVLHARQIERIALGGAGTIESDPLRSPRLQVSIGGSGSIDVKSIESDALTVAIGGSGNLRAGGGSVARLSVSIGGSGDVQLAPLQAGAARVSVAGSGDATVWARDSLRVTIAGSGDVKYYGDPALNRTVAGSGEALRLGAAPR